MNDQCKHTSMEIERLKMLLMLSQIQENCGNKIISCQKSFSLKLFPESLVDHA